MLFFLFFREKRTYIKNTKTHQALNISTNTNTHSPTNHSINLPKISPSKYQSVYLSNSHTLYLSCLSYTHIQIQLTIKPFTKNVSKTVHYIESRYNKLISTHFQNAFLYCRKIEPVFAPS